MVQSEQKTRISPTGRFILLLGANLALMAGSSLSPGLPAIRESFKDVPGIYFWTSMVLTLPALFVVLGGPILGFLVDRFGRKPVLIGSLILGGLGGSLAFVMQTLFGVLVTRALVGFSIAGSMTATNSLVADFFEGDERAKFMGQVYAFTGISGVVFLTLGGFLANIDWHYSFLSYLPALLIAPLAMIFIHEPQEVIAHEADALKTKLKFKPVSIYIFIAIMLNQVAFMSVPVFIATYLKDLVGVGSVEVGFISAFSGLLSFIGGLIYGWINRHYSFMKINIGSFILYSFGFLALGLAQGWPLIVLGEILVGFGMGVIPSNLATWLANEAQPLVRGRANGVYITMMYLGNFASSVIFTPIVQATRIEWAYFISALLVLFAGIAGFVLQNTLTNSGE
ncbi:MAG: MFS transporter [Anaerolineaceae bacterium]|nr:MFS transporter [Anaerolineaceae bacterium]